ncbi:c-type cytochrome [Halomonas alkalicola]|uniref:Cytochrome c-551 n=1 Tax=Halomonas alkalicola TaxID=1930622 RepID=A0ABY9H5B4_9GAMM|nr:c-type cytochrome [Halomonas alkalicola]WLI73670.1 c-type cytochrome [Halomonas alkalicola]
MNSHSRWGVGLCSVLMLSGAAFAEKNDEAMIDLAWESGCFNCHDLDKPLLGPAWRDVAERYRDDDEALSRLVVTVRDGGSGNWGEERMTPNRRAAEEEIERLVSWLLSLDARED